MSVTDAPIVEVVRLVRQQTGARIELREWPDEAIHCEWPPMSVTYTGANVPVEDVLGAIAKAIRGRVRRIPGGWRVEAVPVEPPAGP